MKTGQFTSTSPLPPLALDFLSVSGAHPVEHIEAAAANGFSSVGLRLTAPVGLPLKHDIVNDAELLRETSAALKRTSIQLLDVEAFTLNDSTKTANLDPAFAVAAELGAKIVQVVVEDSDVDRAQQRFAEMCALAERYKMIVALEFMKWRSLKSLAEAWDFISGAGMSNGTLCIDTLHLSRCGDGPEGIAALPSGSIGYVQLCDAPAILPPLEAYLAEARGGRMYPGEGELWMQELLDVLPEDIPLSIEVPRAIDAEKSVMERAKLAAEAMRRFYTQRASRS